MKAQQKQTLKWVPGKFIGKGSYGSVCLGVQESDGGLFAVKSAAKDSLPSIDAIENEIRILRSISSPFVVEYFGDDETASHRNLHLEYLPGGDVAKSGAVGDSELIRSYAWCLVMALKKVHSKGIVHCDVKGSNVLVGSTKGVVKLSDFGSAKRLADDDQTMKIVPRGSPLWMAPESIRGESQGCESDVWSLGCTVIEMFTGTPAWKDCGAHTLFQIGYSDDLPVYPAQLPELAKDFLDKCLSRNPEQRWSCDQLLQHPFLLPVSASKITESSPRSILDWQNLDFSDDEEDYEYHQQQQTSSPSYEQYDLYDEISAKDRIGELAKTSGVNWESDGWVAVRNLRNEKEEDSVGTNWEDSEDEEENVRGENRGIQVDDYPTWINSRIDNGSDDDDGESSVGGADGVDRCGHGDLDGADRGEDSETDVSASLLLITLIVMYSSSNNNIKFRAKYEHFIGLLNISGLCQVGIYVGASEQVAK